MIKIKIIFRVQVSIISSPLSTIIYYCTQCRKVKHLLNHQQTLGMLYSRLLLLGCKSALLIHAKRLETDGLAGMSLMEWDLRL
jgi:hypothetical protein